MSREEFFQRAGCVYCGGWIDINMPITGVLQSPLAPARLWKSLKNPGFSNHQCCLFIDCSPIPFHHTGWPFYHRQARGKSYLSPPPITSFLPQRLLYSPSLIGQQLSPQLRPGVLTSSNLPCLNWSLINTGLAHKFRFSALSKYHAGN